MGDKGKANTALALCFSWRCLQEPSLLNYVGARLYRAAWSVGGGGGPCEKDCRDDNTIEER